MTQSQAEIDFTLKGKRGLAGVATTVIAVVVIGLRAMTIGEVDDDKLRAMAKAELMNQLGGNLSVAMEDLDPNDPDDAKKLMEIANGDNIEIHSMRVSKPLMSMSSNEDVIVLIEYTLPGDPRTKEYWRVRRSVATGWQYRGPSHVVSYLLNFM